MNGKRWIVWLLIFLLGQGAAGEAEMYIRIVSRDASPDAQEEKFKVRDLVLPVIQEHCGDDEALLSYIEVLANEIAPCHADIRQWHPEGHPEGSTLYITIGEGAGPNWWGIFYPKGTALTGEEIDDDEEIHLVWPLLDWICAWLGW